MLTIHLCKKNTIIALGDGPEPPPTHIRRTDLQLLTQQCFSDLVVGTPSLCHHPYLLPPPLTSISVSPSTPIPNPATLHQTDLSPTQIPQLLSYSSRNRRRCRRHGFCLHAASDGVLVDSA